MKTEISRDSHRPEKRYSGVYLQQGRMLTDADWDEMAEIVKLRLRDVLTDLVGTGAPRERGVTIKKVGGKIVIAGSRLYADGADATVTPDPALGIPAGQPFPYEGQADFPDAPPLPTGKACVLYGDTWERTVTALEDPDLLDAGLFGADTATRTQTMGQVKWCLATVDPEDPDQNPPRGDSEPTVELRSTTASRDDCDPCAADVAVEDRVGNYLFRIEVHAVTGPADQPDRVVLKWSRENGAEHYATDPAPPDSFTTGDWIFEFYDLESEKHPGVHLSDSFSPRHGIFRPEYPSTPPGGRPWVRRWDGFATLQRNGAAWELRTGWDRAAELRMATEPESDAQGDVFLNGDFKVYLERLILTVPLTGRTFVAGDYWLAEVRERLHPAMTPVVLSGEPPRGIVHRYVKLAEITAAGNVKTLTTPERRKLNFPPLTDIMAGDVGYQAVCSGFLNATHDTVAKALNRICEITAADVGFEKPCDTSVYEGEPVSTVEDALKLLCDVRAGQIRYTADCTGFLGSAQPTVQDALDRICEIAAQDIPYTPHQDCDLGLTAPVTVKSALDALCTRPSGGGCRLVVTPGEDGHNLERLLESLADGGTKELCVCLMPGEHVLEKGLTLVQAGLGINIVGCGPDSTRILLPGKRIGFDIRAFSLAGVEVKVTSTEARLVLQKCGTVLIDGCRIWGEVAKEPLLVLGATEQIRLSHSSVEAYPANSSAKVTKVAGAADKTLKDLYVAKDRKRFRADARKVSEKLAKTSAAARNQMAAKLKNSVRANRALLSAGENQAYASLIKVLTADVAKEAVIRDVLEKIRDVSMATGEAVAILILNAEAETMLDHDEVVGLVSLHGMPGDAVLGGDEVKLLRQIVAQGQLKLVSSGEDLHLRNNHLDRLVLGDRVIAELKQIVKDQQGSLEGVFETAFYSDNSFHRPLSYFLGVGHSHTGTRFEWEFNDQERIAAILLGENSTYAGVVGPSKSVTLLNMIQGGLTDQAAIVRISIA